MSRRGNCWDNAPQESFFGHMKDEIDINNCNMFDEVKKIVKDIMENTFKMQVPLKVDIEVGNNWYEAK